MDPTPQAINDCILLLETLLEQPHWLAAVDLETRNRLVAVAGRVSRPTRHERKAWARAVLKKDKATRRAADEAQLTATGIRQKRLAPVFVTPDPAALPEARGGIFDVTQGAEAEVEVEAEADPELAARALAEEEDRAGAPQAPPLHTPRTCYVCKVSCERLHFFYDQMCSSCGDFNYAKRSQTANLTGRTALI
ncbi:MAG: hypothetical protein RL685_6965, partial [Pseudomonadota bacterium]